MTSQWDYDDVTIGPEDNQVRRTVNVLRTYGNGIRQTMENSKKCDVSRLYTAYYV